MKLVFALIAGLLAWSADFEVRAQGGLTLQPLAPYCALTSLATPVGFSSCPGGLPLGATYAVVCAYTQGVVWRDDGPAPTATPGTGGQGIAAGQCIPYNGRMAQILFVQQTGGAILGASFYK